MLSLSWRLRSDRPLLLLLLLLLLRDVDLETGLELWPRFQEGRASTASSSGLSDSLWARWRGAAL
jgi:hypothetical protein